MFKRFAVLVFLTLAMAGIAPSLAFAQRKAPSIEKMLSTGGQGTEFLIALPPNEILPYPVEGFEIYVASAFDTDVELYDYSVEKSTRFKLKSYSVKTLSDKKELNWGMEVRDAEIPTRKALRLKSDKPISVYVINSKSLTTDGYMAVPVSGWGKEYIPCTYFDFREFDKWAGGFIVIAKEQCVVDILLRGQGKGDAMTSGGRKIGERITVNLDEGEVYMVHGDGETRAQFDLTGSLVTSSAPIGVIGFHMRTTIPNLLINGNGRNHLCEMLPPSTAWGKRYATVELQRKRLLAGRGDVFRIVCKEDQTRWTCKFYDKATGKLLGSRGGLLQKAGDFQDEIQATAPTASVEGFSVWEANKPVFLMQYSCSSSWDGDQILDPFMFCVTPEEQFITSTIFQSATQQQFSDHVLNLVVKTDTSDPNLIENLKSLEIDGKPVWNNPDAVKPSLLFARMPNGMYWTSIRFGSSAEAHTIKSNGLVSFGGYIYGFGPVDAYGWPAAAGFRPTTSVDTLPPVIKGDSLCGDFTFEATELRNIPDPPRTPPIDTDQVETGIAMIDTVAGRNSYNYRLELITDQVFPSASTYKRFKYEWKVIDKSKDARVIYYVADFAGNITTDTCYYFADRLEFSPSPLSFGKIRLGTNKTLTLTVTNNSDEEVTLTAARILGGTYFKIVSGSIADGQSIKLAGRKTYTFDIQYTGTRETADVLKDWDKDSIQINTGCGVFKHGLQGVAAVPRIKVRDFDAGTRGLNEKFCGPLLIENPGSDTLVITTITGFEGSSFSLSAGFTPALPIVIPPKGRVELKDVCFVSDKITNETKDVTFSNNGEGPDSVSTWTGNTQTPGPGITGYDWLQRRVGTRHPWRVKVYNTGNQEITLNDVNFTTGGKYFPAGSDETNFVFKIGSIINKSGATVTTVALKGDSADVEVFFRPGAEQIYNAEITPIWASTQEYRTARLVGEGIIPKIATNPISLSCDSTEYGVEARRDMIVTNSGTMPLTIIGISLGAGAPAGYSIVSTPTFPITVAPLGGTYTLSVSYTRPSGVDVASSANIEFVHDAAPGTGVDATTLVETGPHVEKFSVGSCDGPDLRVNNLDFGRRLANCEAPELTFTIENPSVSPRPLEIRALNITGTGAGAYSIVSITASNGTQVSVPFTVGPNDNVKVAVRFTPTQPNATPWADQPYSASIVVDGYAQGDAAPFKTETVTLDGTGYVVPVTMDLYNDQKPGGQAPQPGARAIFRVKGSSANWGSAQLRSFTADVMFDPATLSFDQGSLQTEAAAPGWNVAGPVITSISPTLSRMRFTLSGPAPIATDGPIFAFSGTLLLSDKFNAKQDLVVDLGRPCLVPSTTGDSTAVFNCALTRRVVDVSFTRSMISPISPNPVRSGNANLSFGIGISAPATIEIINAQGTVVRTLVNAHLQVGNYDMSFDTQDLASGVYFVRMRTVEFDTTQRLVISE
ncbi:MAG: hypothetical protein RL594_1328 [Bacteroidota bacterium]|jgi:hypothetical protein